MAAQTPPAGYHTVTPYLTAHDAVAAIDFYKAAFGAVEVVRLAMPDGAIAHAEVKIGDSHVMLGQEDPAWGNKSPKSLGGTPSGFMVYVPDADAAFARAVAAGATPDRPLEDQFWGDRSGSVTDPFGHKWTLATHVEDVAPAEMQKRMDAWIASMAPPEAKAA
jgi:PhnB protein